MTKFRFIGNGKNDPETITVFGVKFEGTEPAEVTDEAAVRKLRGNSHFEEVTGATGPTMKHSGRGKYDVFMDGELIADNMSKEEAEALINGNAD